ncbi:ECF-type sigma factor [Ahniella affigens]|nr:ECF-type sigma factor [Ahniella affigens]
MPTDPGVLTAQLQRWREGDGAAMAALSSAVYGELRRLAEQRLRGERGETLQPTSLVNEVFVRLLGADRNIQNRAHFFGLAALHMRAILVDHARARQSEKRGGDVAFVTLSDVSANQLASAEFLELDDALTALGKVDARAAQVVELTYFGGLERDEVATVLDISVSSVFRALRFGQTWLKRELSA